MNYKYWKFIFVTYVISYILILKFGPFPMWLLIILACASVGFAIKYARSETK